MDETRPIKPLANAAREDQTSPMVNRVTVACQECRVELAPDSPELRLELTCNDEPIVYCSACWEHEVGEQFVRAASLGGGGRSRTRCHAWPPRNG